jgi:hypothetical protein
VLDHRLIPASTPSLDQHGGELGGEGLGDRGNPEHRIDGHRVRFTAGPDAESPDMRNAVAMDDRECPARNTDLLQNAGKLAIQIGSKSGTLVWTTGCLGCSQQHQQCKAQTAENFHRCPDMESAGMSLPGK